MLAVYAMITAPIDGARFVKFGISTDVRERVMHVQHGCPINLEATLYVECASEQAMMRLEAALHAEHVDASVGGEWFRLQDNGRVIADVFDALLYVGQREMGAAHVMAVDMPKRVDAKARALGRYRVKALRTCVNVGDVEPGSVPVAYRRKITLDKSPKAA